MEKNTFKVLQISDLHLLDNEDDNLYGINPYKSLSTIVNVVSNNTYDAVIITGDISDNGSILSYNKAYYLLKNISGKKYWIHGNHDNYKNLCNVFSKNNSFLHEDHMIVSNWLFIFANTVYKGHHQGLINKNSILNIRSLLSNSDAYNNIAIVMHHHPHKVNTPLIDNYMLLNPDDLLNLVINNRLVKLIISGHVHNDYSIDKKGYSIECSPSTSFQFKKSASLLNIENKTGFKEFYLSKSGYECISYYL